MGSREEVICWTLDGLVLKSAIYHGLHWSGTVRSSILLKNPAHGPKLESHKGLPGDCPVA